MKSFICISLWFVLLSPASPLQRADSQPATGETHRIATEAYMQFHQRIDAEEIGRYESLLHLTSEQRLAVAKLYSSLLAAYESLDTNGYEALHDQALRVGQIINDSDYLPEQARFMEKHFNDVMELNAREVVLEEQFFDSVGELLQDEQQDALVRVRYKRQRLRYPPHGATVPGANIDLMALMNELGVENASCLPFIEDYETTLGHLRRKRYEEDIQRRVADASVMAAHAMQMDTQALNERAVMLRRLVRVDKRLRAVNVVMLENLRICLEESDAQLIRDAARRLMYPRLFPDQDADKVRARARGEQKHYAEDSLEYAAFAELIDNFEARYEAIVGVLIEHVVADREQFESTLFAFADDRAAQKQLLADLLEQREQICREYHQEIEDLQAELEDQD